MTREEQNQAAGLPAGFEHKGTGVPAYRPIRAKLLLQVEGREPVEVFAFEPWTFDPLGKMPAPTPWHFVPVTQEGVGLVGTRLQQIDAALTVEVRELLAEQRKHEDPTETEDR